MSGSFYPHTFAGAEDYLKGGRSKIDRPVARNTRLRRITADSIALVLHNTAVVTYHRDGTQSIYSGGWNTQTTKQRIHEYSNARVYNAPGSYQCTWVVGHTGERTPPKVQKCRSCKRQNPTGSGTATWVTDDWCHGPDYWSMCSGGTTKYGLPLSHPDWWESKYIEPCGHGNTERHATAPCHHGEWQRHVTGQSEKRCHGCHGTGTQDYGSKPIEIEVSASAPFLLDADGKFIRLLDSNPSASTDYALQPKPKYKPSPSVNMPQHHFGSEIADRLAQVLPGINALVKHPVTGDHERVRSIIVNLNDGHRWSRERIADWLDTLDTDLRFPTPKETAA
jgi:hypothetical protein